MRLFVALAIPEVTREAMRALVVRLAPVCRGARWSRPEGIHLTLKFIGEVTTEKADLIRTELGAVGGHPAFDVEFRGAGFFPIARHPRVLWVGVEAGPILAELAGDIARRLEPLGIARETREFHPHLTLARFKTAEDVPGLHAELAEIEKMNPPRLEFGRGTFTHFHLMESTLRTDGARYTTLESFRFAPANSTGSDDGAPR